MNPEPYRLRAGLYAARRDGLHRWSRPLSARARVANQHGSSERGFWRNRPGYSGDGASWYTVGGLLGFPQAAYDTYSGRWVKRRRPGGPTEKQRTSRGPKETYGGGTYDAGAVPWRESWSRLPKGWTAPDQPWPTGGGGGGSNGTPKSHFHTKVSYTRT